MKKIFDVASNFSFKLAQKEVNNRQLSELLAYLRAAFHVNQSHHWQTNGDEFYADHLLFQRIYEEGQPFIDDVAERAVGLGTTSSVDALNQIDATAKLVHKVYEMAPGESPDDMINRSLAVEQMVLDKIKSSIDELETYNSLTHGVSNLLEGIADKHETFIYLLKRRSTK